MGQVRSIILVDRQAETTFKASDVILEEVRVLVQVDGLERELAKTFATVGIGSRGRCDTSAAEFGTCAILYRSAMFVEGSCWGSYLVIHICGSIESILEMRDVMIYAH